MVSVAGTDTAFEFRYYCIIILDAKLKPRILNFMGMPKPRI